MTHTPRLFVPLITPFAQDLSVDVPRLQAVAQRMLDDGADGLAPFGTTSEATSMSVEERIMALEALVEAGIDPGCLIPGTGCAALPDTIRLTRHAVSLGARGTLTLPPFFYKPLSEEGVFAAYARVIEAVGPGLRLFLYHIPQMSGVPITVELIGRLMDAFPGVVAGLKDSSGNWDNTAAIIAAFPEIETYSASEALLVRNVAAGGAGCISASANINAHGIAALIRGLGTPDEAALLADAAAIRGLCEKLPLIPGVKAIVARRMKDDAYARVRPPLVAVGQDHSVAVAAVAARSYGESASV
ncbi:dihydrodipicolinate synthase family protein [Pseudotabrizicola algicola]|uniref:Dihydrodipicolinate synthase family protein n=1 Tax=Pseudotabrizicola algicola TaxID=2709381 RepID=A0A6B3RRL0_9RHOB|nr:dihydrodipicolinate synthase family protein [Pseudotabrizicola algicola]NEX46625.1 dihydrodipicolinate synthase family protein [Pseudotabrizicola algicola]